MLFGSKIEPEKDDRIYCIAGMFPTIDNIEFLPTEILWQIFARLNDLELLHVGLSSQRFRPISQAVFGQRYSSKNFVISGKFKRETYWIINHFGVSIKSIEAHGLQNIDENHWLMHMLHKCQIEKLYFNNCDFENLRNTLSHHRNLTHLGFQRCSSYSFARLSGFRNLTEFKVHHFDGMYYTEFQQIISDNPLIDCLEIVDDSLYYPWEIIKCVNQHMTHLKKLCVVNEEMPLRFPTIHDLNKFEHSSKHLESLGISTDNRSVQFLQRLSSNCKNIISLNLFHVDHTLNSDMAEVIGSFDQIQSLSLVLKSYDEKIVFIVKNLPNLINLCITYRNQTPLTNNYILSLLQECKSLESIVMDTHLNRFKPKQPHMDAEFHIEFNKITLNRSNHVKIELREEGKTIIIVKHSVVPR